MLNSKLKLLLLSCLIVTLIIAAKQLNFQGFLQTSIIWVESLGVFGPIAYIAIYNLATLLSLAGNLAMINTSHQPTTPETQVWQWIMQVVGLIATVAVTVYITKVAQKALAKSVALVEIINDETQL
ncbi:hypothetical protein FBB35_23665 [Nostoc sp. TCL240-02]|nr:hypothetical protein FBB35_23665 [Nostoc sp. TCL240-02]